MALNNLQIKVYPETEQDFNTLMTESDSSTKGKFLELLIENYKNPKVKNVFQDTPETRKRIEELENEVEELLRERDIKDNREATVTNELTTLRNFFNEINTIFRPYLLICQREKWVEDFPGLFKLMLNELHKGQAFILGPNDLNYIKNYREE